MLATIVAMVPPNPRRRTHAFMNHPKNGTRLSRFKRIRPKIVVQIKEGCGFLKALKAFWPIIQAIEM